MQRVLIATALFAAACAASPSTPPTTPARGHLAATDDRPTMTHPESDVTCQEEVRTGTHLDKRICRSQLEKDHDKQFVQDALLNPSSRPRFEGPARPPHR